MIHGGACWPFTWLLRGAIDDRTQHHTDGTSASATARDESLRLTLLSKQPESCPCFIAHLPIVVLAEILSICPRRLAYSLVSRQFDRAMMLLLPTFALDLRIGWQSYPLLKTPRGVTMLTSLSTLETSCECFCGTSTASRQATLDALSLIISHPTRILDITLPSCTVTQLGTALAESGREVEAGLRAVTMTVRNCHRLTTVVCPNPHAFGQLVQGQAACLASITINYRHSKSIEDSAWMSGAIFRSLPQLVTLRLTFFDAVSHGVQGTLDFRNFVRALLAASSNLTFLSLWGKLQHVDLDRLLEACNLPKLRNLQLEHAAGPDEKRHVAASLPLLLKTFPSIERIEGREGPIFIRHTSDAALISEAA